jgi:hypothetical protein
VGNAVNHRDAKAPSGFGRPQQFSGHLRLRTGDQNPVYG